MPLFYPYHILASLLNGRDAESLKVSEAKKIVAEFWVQVYAKSLGQRNLKQLERVGLRALETAGLKYLA